MPSRLPQNRLSTVTAGAPHATAQRETPKRPSKPPEGTGGAAPLSKSVTAVGLLDCGSASASRLDDGTACGLVGAALAVFVSADCRGSVLGLLAAVVWVALAAAAFAFGAASGAAWPPSFDPNRLLKKLPIPPELEGAADATCTDDRAETGVDSTEAKLNVFPVEASAGGET